VIDFLGVGPERTGTSTLWRVLEKHPNVSFPVRPWHAKYPNSQLDQSLKCLYWYDWKNFNAADKNVYESHWDEGGVRGEISGTYFNFPERIFSVYPDVKIIITWRDPVQRFLSQLALIREQLFVKKFSPYVLSHIIDPYNTQPDTIDYIVSFLENYNETTFTQAVEQYFLEGVENRFAESALHVGHPNRLQEWYTKSKNLLVIQSEDLYYDQQQAINKVTDFLLVDRMVVPETLHFNKKPKVVLSDTVLQKIEQFYRV
jgi:hypothetical protein